MDSNHLNGYTNASARTTDASRNYTVNHFPLDEKTKKILIEGARNPNPSIIEYLASIDKKLDKVIEGLERLR